MAKKKKNQTKSEFLEIEFLFSRCHRCNTPITQTTAKWSMPANMQNKRVKQGAVKCRLSRWFSGWAIISAVRNKHLHLTSKWLFFLKQVLIKDMPASCKKKKNTQKTHQAFGKCWLSNALGCVARRPRAHTPFAPPRWNNWKFRPVKTYRDKVVVLLWNCRSHRYCSRRSCKPPGDNLEFQKEKGKKK